jgi:hypothetical protein
MAMKNAVESEEVKHVRLRLEAAAYVDRVGVAVARDSNHYLTAHRHCECGECFCCLVKQVVDERSTP